MILQVNSNKTFNEYLTDNPNLYDGVDGYSWSDAENRWVDTGVTNTTKALIQEWFGMRNVCDDTKFSTMFRRKMNICALRYAQLSRIELSAFDPLVADYMERQTIESSTRTASGSSNHTGSGTTEQDGTDSSTRTPNLTDAHTDTRTPNLTESVEGETTGTSSTTQGGSDTTTESGSTNATHKEMSKQAPQSISYAGGGVGGALPTMDWQYATAQGQSEDSSGDSKTSTVQHGATESGTTGGTNEQTTTHTGTEQTVGQDTHTGTETTAHTNHTEGTHSDTAQDTTSSSETGSGDRREISTGRGGLTPQEAFSKAVSYLRTSSAFEWLKGEMEECFLSVYDI